MEWFKDWPLDWVSPLSHIEANGLKDEISDLTVHLWRWLVPFYASLPYWEISFTKVELFSGPQRYLNSNAG